MGLVDDFIWIKKLQLKSSGCLLVYKKSKVTVTDRITASEKVTSLIPLRGRKPSISMLSTLSHTISGMHRSIPLEKKGRKTVYLKQSSTSMHEITKLLNR